MCGPHRPLATSRCGDETTMKIMNGMLRARTERVCQHVYGGADEGTTHMIESLTLR